MKHAPAPPTLWRHGDFLRLWAAQTISSLGQRVTRTAVPMISVLSSQVDDFAVAALAALTVAPGLVVALFGGGPVDRARKRPVMIASDLIRAAVVLSLPLAQACGLLTYAWLATVAALTAAATVLVDLADRAYLPSLIPRDRLLEGNAKLQATDSVAEILGPGLGGALAAALTAPTPWPRTA